MDHVHPDSTDVLGPLRRQSPTTCTSIGLFNQSQLFPDAEQKPFDLVLSGPNLGRNTGAAFAMSSGTLGAAMAGALSKHKAIAVSYAHFSVVPKAIQDAIDAKGLSSGPSQPTSDEGEETDPPQPPAASSPSAWKHVVSVAPVELVQIAHNISIDLVERLVREWEPCVGVYSINVPLAWTLKDPQVFWTAVWKNSYPKLFKLMEPQESGQGQAAATHIPASAPKPKTNLVFAPEMSSMMARGSEESFVGTDACECWAIKRACEHVMRSVVEQAERCVAGENADMRPRPTPTPTHHAATPTTKQTNSRWALCFVLTLSLRAPLTIPMPSLGHHFTCPRHLPCCHTSPPAHSPLSHRYQGPSNTDTSPSAAFNLASSRYHYQPTMTASASRCSLAAGRTGCHPPRPPARPPARHRRWPTLSSFRLSARPPGHAIHQPNSGAARGTLGKANLLRTVSSRPSLVVDRGSTQPAAHLAAVAARRPACVCVSRSADTNSNGITESDERTSSCPLLSRNHRRDDWLINGGLIQPDS